MTKPITFTIISNEIVGRLDPHYYKPEFKELENKLRNSKWEIKELKTCLDYYKKGIEVGSDSYVNEGIPFIRVADIDDYKIKYEKADKKIKSELYEKLKEHRPQKDELLFSKDGSVGFCVVVNENKNSIISGGILRLKVKEKINNFYVKTILSSKFFKTLTERESIGSIIKHLTPEVFLNLKIPIPPLQIQNKIISIMDKAYYTKKQNEEKVRNLIDSIDDYVLDELGIKLPELNDEMTYTVSSEEVEKKRIDTYYYQPKFKEIEKALSKGKYEIKEIKNNLIILNELENIEKYDFINYVDLASINKNLGLIKTYNKLKTDETPSRARQKIDIGDLLLSGLSGSLRSIAVFDSSINNAICSTGFYVIKKTQDYNNYYLWALFRNPILQILLQRESSGAIMSAVNREALQNLKIPLPPLHVQNKIADNVKKRMQKAEQLQKEAKEKLEKAKSEVESIILG